MDTAIITKPDGSFIRCIWTRQANRRYAMSISYYDVEGYYQAALSNDLSDMPLEKIEAVIEAARSRFPKVQIF